MGCKKPGVQPPGFQDQGELRRDCGKDVAEPRLMYGDANGVDTALGPAEALPG